MKLKILLFAIIIGFIAILTFAQSKGTNNTTPAKVRLKENKPTVYLDFIKIEKRKETITTLANSESIPVKKTEEIEAVVLRLHNNSAWAIQLRTNADNFSIAELKPLQDKRLVHFIQPNSEQELMYGVEPVNAEVPVTAQLKQKLPYIRLYGSYSDLWLGSGQSINFAVRREELKRNLQIFMPFKYEWETSEKNKGYDEPQHRVYFTWDKFENAAGL